jgi:uncharacterized membrane protein YphA (DoxX/SURF4 family)
MQPTPNRARILVVRRKDATQRAASLFNANPEYTLTARTNRYDSGRRSWSSAIATGWCYLDFRTWNHAGENEMNENWPIVNFIVRWILGLLFLMAGYWKVFVLTPTEHASQFFVDGFADYWIPEWLLYALGLSIPFLELAAGLLICLGLRTREALIFVGLLLIVTTYGHALQDPLFDIDGHTFTRLALIVFLLLAPAGSDKFSADHWLASRKPSTS